MLTILPLRRVRRRRCALGRLRRAARWKTAAIAPPRWPDEQQPPPERTATAPSTSAGHDVALWRELKARDVGDPLTILLVENTSARRARAPRPASDAQRACRARRSSAARDRQRHAILEALDGNASSTAHGDSTQSNALDGDITVTVAQALPTATCWCAARSGSRINQGEEFVQVQGIVRPSDIGPDNRIFLEGR